MVAAVHQRVQVKIRPEGGRVRQCSHRRRRARRRRAGGCGSSDHDGIGSLYKTRWRQSTPGDICGGSGGSCGARAAFRGYGKTRSESGAVGRKNCPRPGTESTVAQVRKIAHDRGGNRRWHRRPKHERRISPKKRDGRRPSCVAYVREIHDNQQRRKKNYSNQHLRADTGDHWRKSAKTADPDEGDTAIVYGRETGRPFAGPLFSAPGTI